MFCPTKTLITIGDWESTWKGNSFDILNFESGGRFSRKSQGGGGTWQFNPPRTLWINTPRASTEYANRRFTINPWADELSEDMSQSERERVQDVDLFLKSDESSSTVYHHRFAMISWIVGTAIVGTVLLIVMLTRNSKPARIKSFSSSRERFRLSDYPVDAKVLLSPESTDSMCIGDIFVAKSNNSFLKLIQIRLNADDRTKIELTLAKYDSSARNLQDTWNVVFTIGYSFKGAFGIEDTAYTKLSKESADTLGEIAQDTTILQASLGKLAEGSTWRTQDNELYGVVSLSGTKISLLKIGDINGETVIKMGLEEWLKKPAQIFNITEGQQNGS